jgi:hypothetical protein
MQQELLPVRHRSLQPRRLRKPKRNGPWHEGLVNPERIYAANWKAKNRRQPSVNRGLTLLEWVLCPDGRDIPLPVSQRDAEVAASVVQWLGTACGLGFIRECEDAIDKARRTEEERRARPSLLERERKAQEELRRMLDAKGRVNREIHLEE